MSREVLALDLGLTEYLPVYHLQKTLVHKIAARRFPQTLLLLEHLPVYTVGKSGPDYPPVGNIPVLRVDRGGDITFHGPGQLVGYPLLQMKEKKVSSYIKKLEESIICLLQKYSIRASIKQGFPGVWVKDKKIASVGVRVKDGVSYHGFALNLTVNLEAFQYINPCGMEIAMTSMQELLPTGISMQKAKKDYIESFERCFYVKTVLKDLALVSCILQ